MTRNLVKLCGKNTHYIFDLRHATKC